MLPFCFQAKRQIAQLVQNGGTRQASKLPKVLTHSGESSFRITAEGHVTQLVPTKRTISLIFHVAAHCRTMKSS